MKINTALILCAGYGKRLNPLTLKEPKPLLQINEITLLENCINLIKLLGIKKVIINTFYLEGQIKNFINIKKFDLDIKIVNDGKIYFSNHIQNILLLVNKKLSFDKNLKGDFNLLNNTIKKNSHNDLIYTGCQIINKDLFDTYSVSHFSISEVWNQLVDKNKLYGYESLESFYHLTNLEVYKELLKNN